MQKPVSYSLIIHSTLFSNESTARFQKQIRFQKYQGKVIPNFLRLVRFDNIVSITSPKRKLLRLKKKLLGQEPPYNIVTSITFQL